MTMKEKIATGWGFAKRLLLGNDQATHAWLEESPRLMAVRGVLAFALMGVLGYALSAHLLPSWVYFGWKVMAYALALPLSPAAAFVFMLGLAGVVATLLAVGLVAVTGGVAATHVMTLPALHLREIRKGTSVVSDCFELPLIQGSLGESQGPKEGGAAQRPSSDSAVNGGGLL